MSWRDALWPTERLGEALELLTASASVGGRAATVPGPRFENNDRSLALERWFDAAARQLGVEVEAVESSLAGLEAMLWRAAPGVLWVPGAAGEPPRFALVHSRFRTWRAARTLRLLSPARGFAPCAVTELVEAMVAPWAAARGADIEGILAAAEVPASRRAKAARHMLSGRLADAPIARGWLLRMEPGAPLLALLGRAGSLRRVGSLLGAQLALQVVGGAGWALLGAGALEGTLDASWLSGWWLSLLTMVPLQLWASWHAGMLSFEAGAAFKQRMLAGALRLDPDVTRRDGAGTHLGRVIEASALEASALNGAALGLSLVLQLGSAASVMLFSGVGALPVVAFALWSLLAVLLGWRYGRTRMRWTDTRMAMSGDLVERMLGHRTRLAQEPPSRWHTDEDRALDGYVSASRTLDESGAVMSALIPRGWLLVGLFTMLPSWLDPAVTEARVALSVGALMVGASALRALVTSAANVAAAWIAWRSAGPVFRAASKVDAPGAAQLVQEPDAATRARAVVLDAQELVYCHEGRREPTLSGVSLQIREGDRVLLEGPSGGGKSTLGALLAGLRTPTGGLLLLHGIDAQSVGAKAWRRAVVLAPQFHENHVLQGTLAFNLLMGRRWPPSPQDLAEAEALCGELGLGPLLERMPSGLQTIVGETGWRLSHGERSRIFIVRALLQDAEVVVLDESLGALDPETMSDALRCVLARAKTLVMIAHP